MTGKNYLRLNPPDHVTCDGSTAGIKLPVVVSREGAAHISKIRSCAVGCATQIMTSPHRLRLPLPANERGLILVILAVITVAALLDSNHTYWNDPWPSAVDIARQTALLGIFSLGAAVVIVSGGIDLSVGSMIAFAGTTCAS